MSLLTLPHELLVDVFQRLNLIDFYHLSSLCSAIPRILKDDQIWKRFCQEKKIRVESDYFMEARRRMSKHGSFIGISEVHDLDPKILDKKYYLPDYESDAYITPTLNYERNEYIIEISRYVKDVTIRFFNEDYYIDLSGLRRLYFSNRDIQIGGDNFNVGDIIAIRFDYLIDHAAVNIHYYRYSQLIWTWRWAELKIGFSLLILKDKLSDFKVIEGKIPKRYHQFRNFWV